MKNISIKAKFYIVSLFCVLVCIGSINGWSLWLDESSTAFFAGMESFSELKSTLYTWHGSETQMPGYIICMYMWSSFFGISEIALRYFNIVPTIMMLLYTYSIVVRAYIKEEYKQKVVLFVFLAFVSSFIVYNLNEARVNHTLFALGSITLSSLVVHIKYRKLNDLYVFLASLIVGYFFNMLYFMIGIPCLYIIFRTNKSFFIDCWKYLVVPVMLLGILSIYYLQTLLSGSGGMVEKPGISNIAYSIYEFCGFGGLGIPKNDMRVASDLIELVGTYILPLGLGVLAYVGLITSMLTTKFRSKTILLLIISLVGFMAIAYVANFRFWGRHMMMLYPIYIYILSELLYHMIKCNFFTKLSALFFVAVLFLSSYRIVTKEEYKKDNVKDAIAYANSISGDKNVYYMGFNKLADYYHLNNYRAVTKTGMDGLLLYHKSMSVVYEMQGSYNPLKDTGRYQAVLLWSDRWSELYRITQKLPK